VNSARLNGGGGSGDGGECDMPSDVHSARGRVRYVVRVHCCLLKLKCLRQRRLHPRKMFESEVWDLDVFCSKEKIFVVASLAAPRFLLFEGMYHLFSAHRRLYLQGDQCQM
jgi:hypothetical protein